jgi:hypothetical protein
VDIGGNGTSASGRVADLQKVPRKGPLSALLRRSQFAQRPTALDPFDPLGRRFGRDFRCGFVMPRKQV